MNGNFFLQLRSGSHVEAAQSLRTVGCRTKQSKAASGNLLSTSAEIEQRNYCATCHFAKIFEIFIAFTCLSRASRESHSGIPRLCCLKSNWFSFCQASILTRLANSDSLSLRQAQFDFPLRRIKFFRFSAQSVNKRRSWLLIMESGFWLMDCLQCYENIACEY